MRKINPMTDGAIAHDAALYKYMEALLDKRLNTRNLITKNTKDGLSRIIPGVGKCKKERKTMRFNGYVLAERKVNDFTQVNGNEIVDEFKDEALRQKPEDDTDTWSVSRRFATK